MGQKRRLSGRWLATQSRPLAWREETWEIVPPDTVARLRQRADRKNNAAGTVKFERLSQRRMAHRFHRGQHEHLEFAVLTSWLVLYGCFRKLSAGWRQFQAHRRRDRIGRFFRRRGRQTFRRPFWLCWNAPCLIPIHRGAS